jgi:hypothetical protein
VTGVVEVMSMFDARIMLDLVAQQADSFSVMCLRCGSPRTTRRLKSGQLEPAECPSCRYVGWRESEGEPPRLAGPPSDGVDVRLH